MNTPSATAQTNVIQAFRERVLNVLLLVALVVAVPLAIPNAYRAAQAGLFLQAGVYIGATLFVGILLLLRQAPHTYAFRAVGLVLVLYMVAVVVYLSTGLEGDGRIWLFGAMAIGVLLLPQPYNFLNVLAAISVHFALGYGFSHGILPPPPNASLVDSLKATAWQRTGFTLLGVATTVLSAVGVYRRHLENVLEESQTLNTVLEEERRRLENQSKILQRRVEQIHTASEIMRIINTILDPDELLQRVVDLVRERFNLYYVGIFLVDERGEYAVLRAGTGEAGRKMLAEGHRLAIGGASMIGWCLSNRQPRIAMDVGDEPVRFANPHLPLTRTELALPIISRGEILGAMTVQSEKPQAFDQDDLLVLQNIADSVATALQNARLYQEAQRGLRELTASRRQTLFQAAQHLNKETVEVSVGDSNGHSSEENLTLHLLKVPITLYDAPIGEITLESDHPWTDEEREFAAQVGAQIAVALENLYLAEEHRRIAEENRLISQVTEQVSATLDLDTIIQTAVTELQGILNLTEAEIRLTVPEAVE